MKRVLMPIGGPPHDGGRGYGHIGVGLGDSNGWAEDLVKVEWDYGRPFLHLPPSAAREFALALLRAADAAEARR